MNLTVRPHSLRILLRAWIKFDTGRHLGVFRLDEEGDGASEYQGGMGTLSHGELGVLVGLSHDLHHH